MEDTDLVLNAGRYVCQRILGEGSMGRTYLALDSESGEEVAVKALYPSRLATIKDLELFEREADILQRLDHPQIPRYIDAFHEGDGEAICYFLVQTYVEGKTLREVIDEKERFDEPEILAFLKSVATVLAYMHSLNPSVVHRDIKPSNIIVFGEERLPTLIDFGAVREVVRLTMGGGSTIIGTFGYMPPEQLMGRAIPATDLYALGITALECLTRRTPADLHGEDSARMIDALPGSDALKRVMRRLCAPSLTERYESADQLLADLDSMAQNTELIHAGQIETDVARRMREHQRRLAKETGIGIPLSLVVAGIMIASATVLAGYFLMEALTDSLESGFLVAGMISMVGAAIPLGIKFKRYVHDAWSPPAEGWVKSTCKVTDLTLERHADPNTNQIYSAYYLLMEFPTPSGMYRDKILIGRNANEGHYELKDKTFDIYYRPGRPEAHEVLDFLHGNYDDEAAGLFDHRAKHLPG